MRARARDDVPPGAGAEHGLRRGLVGIGEGLETVPESVEEAVTALVDRYGEKAGRMVERFVALPEGTLVWTRADAEQRTVDLWAAHEDGD